MQQPNAPIAETPEQTAKREAAARWEHDRADRTGAAMFPMVSSFAVESLKAAALVNGGSAAAMLAFIGTGRQPVTLDTILGLKLFWGGLLASAVATALSYLAQYCYLREMQQRIPIMVWPFIQPTPASRRSYRLAIGCHVLGISLVLASFGCAVWGLLLVANSLVPLPAKL